MGKWELKEAIKNEVEREDLLIDWIISNSTHSHWHHDVGNPHYASGYWNDEKRVKWEHRTPQHKPYIKFIWQFLFWKREARGIRQTNKIKLRECLAKIISSSKQLIKITYKNVKSLTSVW